MSLRTYMKQSLKKKILGHSSRNDVVKFVYNFKIKKEKVYQQIYNFIRMYLDLLLLLRS